MYLSERQIFNINDTLCILKMIIDFYVKLDFGIFQELWKNMGLSAWLKVVYCGRGLSFWLLLTKAKRALEILTSVIIWLSLGLVWWWKTWCKIKKIKIKNLYCYTQTNSTTLFYVCPSFLILFHYSLKLHLHYD